MKKKLLNHIQFLRAISVLLIFFYHLKLKYFEYGFLGVDIFFVISGFVISLLIYDEFRLTGTFNFFSFYIKRFKRIYPVLIFILSVTLVFIIFFQPLDLLFNNLKVYFFSLIGISNLYYLFSIKDYFDNVFEDPFAHTWSLGVEEQFYIFFPIFIFFFLKKKNYFKKIYNSLIFFIIIGIVISYIYQDNIKLVFYSPLFRFWEFLFGSLTFFIYKKLEFKSSIWSLGALSLLIFFILIPKNISIITSYLLTIMLTSFFILIYKTAKNSILNNIVENKFVVLFGNISYSFYLWHLPIIYFYDLYFVKNIFHIPLLFLLIFFLSYLSYKYIENKFRYFDWGIDFNFKKITLSFFIVSLTLFTSMTAYQNNYYSFQDVVRNFKNINYLEQKINYSNRTAFYKININNHAIYEFCTEKSKNKILNTNNLRTNCLKIGNKNKKIFYLEGNSHTANYVPMFNEISIEDSIYYNHVWAPLENINFNHINQLNRTYDEVIYATSVENLETLNKLIKLEKKFGKNIKILILGAIPNLNNHTKPLKCLIKNITCVYSSDEDIHIRNLITLKLQSEKLVRNNPKFLYFDPYKAICPNKICKVFDKEINLITHRDQSHLTIEGSILMKKEFMNFYKNFLSN